MDAFIDEIDTLIRDRLRREDKESHLSVLRIAGLVEFRKRMFARDLFKLLEKEESK